MTNSPPLVGMIETKPADVGMTLVAGAVPGGGGDVAAPSVLTSAVADEADDDGDVGGDCAGDTDGNTCCVSLCTKSSIIRLVARPRGVSGDRMTLCNGARSASDGVRFSVVLLLLLLLFSCSLSSPPGGVAAAPLPGLMSSVSQKLMTRARAGDSFGGGASEPVDGVRDCVREHSLSLAYSAFATSGYEAAPFFLLKPP